jgi:hypothetical protein
MIEVSIAHDKDLNRLSDFAQLLYLKVLPHTDDWGRFEGDPEVLKGRVDPLSKRPIAKYEAAMKEIAGAGLWVWFRTDKGKMVLQVSQEAFERINAFLIKSRKNPEYPAYKDSYELICGVMEPITHRKQQAESNKQKEESKEKKEFVAPAVEEVVAYFVQNGYPEALARRAFESYSVADWHDSQGNRVRNWKQKMINVWFKEENRNGGIGSNRGQGGRSAQVSPNKVNAEPGKYDRFKAPVA